MANEEKRSQGEEEDFRLESIQDREAVVRYLTELTEGFRNGRIQLGNHIEKVQFEPAEYVKVDMKARVRSRRSRIILRFSWNEEGARNASESGEEE